MTSLRHQLAAATVAIGAALTTARASAGSDPLGASCTSASSCASGWCVDSVCCDTACDRHCERCDNVAAKGTCSPAPAGTNPAPPRAPCTVGCQAFCDFGGCDGVARTGYGGPALAGTPTDCLGSDVWECRDRHTTSVEVCDGVGGKKFVAGADCGPFICITTYYRSECSKSARCGAPSAGESCADDVQGPGDCAADEYCDGSIPTRRSRAPSPAEARGASAFVPSALATRARGPERAHARSTRRLRRSSVPSEWRTRSPLGWASEGRWRESGPGPPLTT